MTANQKTILAAMDINIENAKTAKLRKFYEDNRKAFLDSIARSERRSKLSPPTAFSSFLSRLESEA